MDKEKFEEWFELNRSGDMIVVKKGDNAFCVRQAGDNDIFFSTASEELELEVSLSSRNYEEWQTYLVFEGLMKDIVGRYMLNDWNGYSNLPEDFIDLESRTITWHSDSNTDNTLRLQYEGELVKISISKSPKAHQSSGNIVRVRTNGSDYGYYYQEFEEFHRRLVELERSINKVEEETPDNKEPISKRKMLSLFRN